MPVRGRDYSHGITEREREVLDRADAGMDSVEISQVVGLDHAYVRQLVRMYSINDTAHRRWCASAIVSNRIYLAAIAATGRSFA